MPHTHETKRLEVCNSHNLAIKKSRLPGKFRNNWLVRSGTVEFGFVTKDIQNEPRS